MVTFKFSEFTPRGIEIKFFLYGYSNSDFLEAEFLFKLLDELF